MKKTEEIHQNFEKVHASWEQELHQFTDAELTKQETPEGWTLGQVYVHLINSALYFHLKQVAACCATNENADQAKTERGEGAFSAGSVPPIRVQVPPSEQYTPKPPQSKQELFDGLARVKSAMTEALSLFDDDQGGRTAHPSMGYLNALDWYQLVEMHWRHHLWQKERILAA
ncbi:MAG: DinB family protein [Saprospiraceae bacterium]|nr:DinB family protein [Saprospiraceae bacterium]